MRRAWWSAIACVVVMVIAACGTESREVGRLESSPAAPTATPEGIQTPITEGTETPVAIDTPQAPAAGTAMSGSSMHEVYDRSDRVEPGEAITYCTGPSSGDCDISLTDEYILDDAGGDGVELLVRGGDRTQTISSLCGSPPRKVDAVPTESGAKSSGSYGLSMDCGGDPESVTLKNSTDSEIHILRVSSILGGVIPASTDRGPEPGGREVAVTFRLALEGEVPPGQGFELSFDADGTSDAMPVTHGGDALVEFCGAPHSGLENRSDCVGGRIYTRTVRFERGATLRYYHFDRISYVPHTASGLGPFRGDSGVRLDRDTTITATYALPGGDGIGARSDGDGFALCKADDITPGVRARTVRGRSLIAVPVSTRGPRCFLSGAVSLTLRSIRGEELEVSGNRVPYIVGVTVPTGDSAPTFVWSNWCGRRGEHIYEVTVSIGRVKKVAQSRESPAPRCDVRGGQSGLGAVGLEQAQGMP